MGSLKYLPIINHQLHQHLDGKLIEAIARAAENLNVEVHSFPGTVKNVIMQPSGLGLLIIAIAGDSPSVRSMSMLVPLTEATGNMMLNDASSSSEVLFDAIEDEDEYLVGCQVVNQFYQIGVPMQTQVNRHVQLVNTETVDAHLIIKDDKTGKLYLTEIFIGDRIVT